MKRKVSKLRLSPNEEARIIREEYERRRKLRIQQVREQQKYIALNIRREVEQKRQHELRKLEEELREAWEQQQREKLQTLQRLYQESLQLVGQGHRSAKENEPDLAAIAQREEENHAKAKDRFQEALKELKTQRLKDHERQNKAISARKKALQAEKERSTKVASLPPPPPKPIENIDPKRPRVLKRSDVSVFAATHYHMPESTVDREADTKQPNAHEEAELEERRVQDLQKEEKRRREEQLEKARLRGREALRREQLVQDRERLLGELEHMQQTDLLRRRQQVSQMPPQIFQPLYKRQEMREDFQREMEFAFEDMYTGERRVKGDLVVRLVPEPLPAHSIGSQDQELDVTLDETVLPETENVQTESEQDVGSAEQETSAEVEASRPAPRGALRKLLDRIRSQRNEWTNHSSRVPAADSPTVFTDQIPERDTSIETGSLLSEEKDKRIPIELHEPLIPPTALEPTKQPAAADTLPPDALATTIQEFEEERKKREDELEREKQQQVLLLQELEEQKAKLEQMLLDAQQEREHLKAAVSQEVAINRPEVPFCDGEDTSVPSGSATELVPPAAEDDHSRRIREYQQRLLEQNRIHQRSVEVAHQRLEEYQRALRMRYNMSTRSQIPAAVPPGLVPPFLHRAQSEHRPAPPQLPTPSAVPAYINSRPQISVEDATRDSDVLASLRRLASSLSNGSKLLSDESVSIPSRNQRPDVTARLTDGIMERVTEHLPERLRPSSVPEEHPPHKLFPTHHSTSVSLQPTSDSIRVIGPSISDSVPLDPGLQSGSLSSTEKLMEKQRRELREAQRRLLEQREAVALQQKLQEEERRRQEQQRQSQEVEMEQMRRQKETLQALIDTDQPVSDTPSEASGSEDIGQKRLRLLASLLKAIEQSNGGSLSHLEDSEEMDDSCQQMQSDHAPVAQSSGPAGPPPPSVLPSLFLHPHRAPKPPVTRVRLGFKDVMTEQHELSAIQEVETPVDISQVAGPQDGVAAPADATDWDLQEGSESSVASDGSLQTPSVSSSGRTAERRVCSERSGHLVWRERLLTGAGTASGWPYADSVLKGNSPLSSDSGRGADFSGPAFTSRRSSTESPHKPPESEWLSSTTISTGSYVTTDREQNVNAGESPHLSQRVEQGRGADLSGVSSLCGQSFCVEESSVAARPARSVDSVFDDSSIQQIIDRYTKELNVSLSTAGKTTDGEGSYAEESGSSASQQFLVEDSDRREEDESSTSPRSALMHPAGTRRTSPELGNPNDPIREHFSCEDHSLAEDSFRPLIGQPADQSSCLAADQRDSALEQLVGQPSAHSSMIGHRPGPPASLSLDQGGWDSALSRMISRLSHQSSSHWLSAGQEFHADQLMGQMASELSWLPKTPEERRMRPLVGELDESAGRRSGSSGERSHVALGVSPETGVPSHPSLPPEASPHSASVPDLNPHPPHQMQHNQTSLLDLDSQRAEDSFHPLLAEVTHNETAEPSMTFHLPEHSMPDTPEVHPARRERSAEFEAHSDSSVGSDPTPERLRTQEPNRLSASFALCESFTQLVVSECHHHDSMLKVSPTVSTDVELTAQTPSNLTMCNRVLVVGTSQSDAGISKVQEDSISFSDLLALEIMPEWDENLREAFPASDEEAATEKGILEQSEITLVSLTDTTLPDQETTVTEEEDAPTEGVDGDKQEGRETEGFELAVKTPENEWPTHRVAVLEFQWGSSLQDVCQQKRSALLQRSVRRVEEIKAKRTRAKSRCEIQGPSKGDQPKAKGAETVTSTPKTKPEPQPKTNKSNGGQAAQKKPQLPPPGIKV
ncbi:uncharacterized protein cep295 isoform 2-T2 [Odontesthes bonariensis]|uniref:uncharacterized protein cep295 isoform X2 n=1 Tax=Odontesthes bonariensis TaxID=219752 RepID=UPI003F587970